MKVAEVQQGIKELLLQRNELYRKKAQMHLCNCEFCNKSVDETKLFMVGAEIEEINREVKRLERYVKEHL